MTSSALIGTWQRIQPASCGFIYPDTIRFEASGLYFGQKEPPGNFTLWDAGTFEVAGPGSIKISTATDAVIAYPYAIAGDVLNFSDAEGCTFGYRRVRF
jgi:hypothetical protein